MGLGKEVSCRRRFGGHASRLREHAVKSANSWPKRYLVPSLRLDLDGYLALLLVFSESRRRKLLGDRLSYRHGIACNYFAGELSRP